MEPGTTEEEKFILPMWLRRAHKGRSICVKLWKMSRNFSIETTVTELAFLGSKKSATLDSVSIYKTAPKLAIFFSLGEFVSRNKHFLNEMCKGHVMKVKNLVGSLDTRCLKVWILFNGFNEGN